MSESVDPADQFTARDRNWNELLQELRVTQTGLLLLTGFLVTLPFQGRFADLSSAQVIGYLAVLCTAVLAMTLVLAPVNYHRALFRQREKEWLVLMGNQCARAGLMLSALALSGVLWLIFDFVVGRTEGVVAGLVALTVFAVVWVGVPLTTRRRAMMAATPPRSVRDDRARHR
ncbi:MAG TPA: DUF6328 family protein [Nocardioidaceae bacterium]|nr:DUF6328 family protein [Nocardioidaceae bacterium]